MTSLVCRDCGRDSEFSASEQEFYAEKGFTNEPGRCPECRAAKKAQNQGGGGYGRQERQMFPAVCATCGKETTVPFQPSGDKPFYCRECFVPPTRNWTIVHCRNLLELVSGEVFVVIRKHL